jgi:hypothetical protein
MRPFRLLFVALAFSLASTPAAAAGAAKTEFGVIAGFNFATLQIDGVSNMDPRGAFAAGGAVDHSFNDKFGLLLEPMFMSKGGKSTERNAYWGTNDGAVFHLDCIDVPLLARYNLGTQEASHGYVLAGVGLSFATQTTVEISQGTTKGDVDFSNIFNSRDFSINAGAGISVPLGDNRMTFDGRVAYGLTDINKGGPVTFNGTTFTVPSNSTHTLDFRLFATYFFSAPNH